MGFPPCEIRLILSVVLSHRRYHLSCRLDVLGDEKKMKKNHQKIFLPELEPKRQFLT